MKRILLVEDSINDIELALEALSGEVYADSVVVVKDGQQALDFLQRAGLYAERESGNPILVVLDLKLPRIDGLEVLRRVKSDPHLQHIPIVMLTSSREESDLRASYSFGANAYVVKQVDFEEYTYALRTLGSFWTAINQTPPDPDRDK